MLEAFAKEIEELWSKTLDNQGDNIFGMDPMAEAEFTSAVRFLQLAEAAAWKAQYHQARALAASPYRS